MRALLTIFFGVLLAGVGLAAGRWLLAPQAHLALEESGETAAAAPAAPSLSPQALRNMGVEVGRAAKQDFVVRQRVQATVVDRPLNLRPVVSPLGGLVVEVRVEPGQIVRGGDVLLVLVRDPIPRPKPELTGDILAPLNENVHETASKLRTAKAQVDLTERELDRIAPFIESQSIPRKTEIDLRYELERGRREVENARSDLSLHGLESDEIARVEAGGHPPPSRSLWKRALEENGLWTEFSEEIYGLLAEAGCACDLPWCVAAIGELSATGLATPDLLEVLRETASARVHFAEVAGLLLEGMPLETVRVLAEQGALEPRVLVRAADLEAASWDVDEVLVRPGQRVEAGLELVRLHDARTMWLRLDPIGSEIGLVTRALLDRTPMRAVPLVEGSGPVLEDLRLQRLATHGELEERGGRAYAEVENRLLAGEGEDALVRSWALRVGLRYLVEVPRSQLPGRFVLPADAVTAVGPERVVFLQDGDTFRSQPVQVEYEDEAVVVIADDGSLFEGDPVVLHGAFALGLALQQGPQAVDPHAGHNHG